MKRILIPLLAALALCACHNESSLKTKVFEDDFALPLGESRPDSLWVKTSVEYPVDGASDAVLKTLREQLGDVLFGGLETSDDIEARAIQYREEVVAEYLDEFLLSAPDTSDHRIMTWTREKTGRFLPDWKDYYCYEEELNEYWGGNHGTAGYITFVFSKADGSWVEEFEFFKDGYEEPVRELICKQLQADVIPQFEKDGFDPEPLNLIIEEGGGWPNGVYVPGKDGVTWTYQPYEIAPYAYGIIRVTVPWDELSEYVR